MLFIITLNLLKPKTFKKRKCDNFQYKKIIELKKFPEQFITVV